MPEKIVVTHLADNCRELTLALRGTVKAATVNGNILELYYEGGGRADIELVQCSTHHCDDNHMTVERVRA